MQNLIKKRDIIKLNNYKIIVLLVISIFYGSSLYCQEYKDIKNITIKDGLPSNVVYGIKQDSKGFIWATTNKGVVRYDGRKFKLYTVEDGLPSNDNFVMLLDSKDNVWLYSFKAVCMIGNNGVVKTHAETNSHFSYFLKNDKDEFYFATKHPIIKDKIYITLAKAEGVKNKTLIETPSEMGFKIGSIAAVYIYDNDLYSSFYNQIDTSFNFHLKFSNGNVTYPKKNAELPELVIKHKARSLTEYVKVNDSVYVLLGPESYKLYVCNKPMKEFIYPQGMIKVANGMTSYFRDDLIVILNKGIFKLDLNLSTYGVLIPTINVYNPTGFIYDNDGNVWVSTLGEGIFKYPIKEIDSKSNYFKNIREERIVKLIGVGTKKLFYTNSKNEIFNFDRKIYNTNPYLSEIRFIETDGDNIYYGGSNALYKNDLQIFNSGFKSFSLRNDSILTSTTFGLNFLSSTNPKMLFTINQAKEKVDIPGRMFSVLLLDKLFYCGNENGLFYGYRSKRQLIPICLTDDQTTVTINSVLESSDGLIWVATEGYGVFVLKDNVPIRHFSKELLDLNIHSMRIDNRNNIWLSSRLGVNKIEKQGDDYVLSSLTSYHGLPSDYVNDTYCYNDILFVATDAGLVNVNLKEINYQEFNIPPPSYLLSGKFISNGTRKNINLNQEGIFDFNQNTISFEYTGISHRSNGKIGFEYRLLPGISNWTATTNDNITFNSLSPGTYTFEVRAINAIGIKSEFPASYSFTINKHYTQTTWFFILIALLLVALSVLVVSTYFRYKRKRFEEANKTQKTISELRLKSLQSQMNPHFIFNSLNAIQQFINVENRRAANDYLARFARLMRLYLGGSENQFISLEQEMEVIRLYCQLEHLRFADKYEYEIKIQHGLDLSEVKVPAMLLQPHVENAIRHGLVPSGKDNNFLNIEVYKLGEGILCSIKDNGVGRSKSLELKMYKQERHRSLGNKISKERLEVIRDLKLANITETIDDVICDNMICGTEVRIFIGF